MVQRTENDRILVSLNEDFVSLTLPDGFRTDVPHVIIERSPVLLDTIPHDNGETYLTMPQGLIMSWIQVLEALNIRSVDNSAKSIGPFRTEEKAKEPILLDFLQAADFLGDKDSLQTLCQHAGKWIFAPSTDNLHRPSILSEDRKQVLNELNHNLIVSVLRVSGTPLLEQLRLLPEQYHTAAVHAAFPSILAHNLIDLSNQSSKLDKALEAVLPRLASITSLQNLDMSHNGIGKKPKAHALHLTSLSFLQTLNLSHNCIGPDAVQVLLPHVAKLTALQHLDLSSNRINSKAAQLAGPFLAKLLQMQQMNLSCNLISVEGAKVLGPCFESMPLLQQLDLSRNIIRVAGARALGLHLVKLTSLQQLNLSCNMIGAKGAEALGPCLAHISSFSSKSVSPVTMYLKQNVTKCCSDTV